MGTILLIIGISVAAILVCRVVSLWYFKIDERIELMKYQNRLLLSIDSKLSHKNGVAPMSIEEKAKRFDLANK